MDLRVPGALSPRIPRWIKIRYSIFLAVMIPTYWHNYGPTNFLYFCDVAVFLTFAALWLENPLLASMGAVSISCRNWFGCSTSAFILRV